MTNSFKQEAARCRAQAAEFAGRPEQPFLLRLSQAFDELAAKNKGVRGHEELLIRGR
jgi:hypothetical protein